MPELTKTRSVLDLVANGLKGESGSELFTVDDNVWFEQPHDEGESLARSRRYVIDRETFNDLGQPTQITVTIEPGDLLNKPDPNNFRGSGVPIGEPLNPEIDNWPKGRCS